MDLSEKASEADVQRIILKMGINVDDGFIYFNEMLYRIMRAQYGKVNFNRVMALNELVAQFRIIEITMHAKEENIKDSQVKEQNFFTKFSASRANPFLTQMFFRMSFYAWYNYMKSKVLYM